jgi:RNA polymerase sigma-70 factor (ECF subfamily)
VCVECPLRLSRDRDAAFPLFVRHHQDLVYRMALRLSDGDMADAEDLAQDALVRAYRRLVELEPERISALRPRGWLAAITLNLARNRARLRRRAPERGPLEAAFDSAAPRREQPEVRAQSRESAREWEERLEALPATWRQAVELRHVAGLSYTEVALALGRPLGTVKSDVHRGVRRLREMLTQEGSWDAPAD